MADFLIRSSQYGSAEKAVLSAFELEEILSASYWEVMANGGYEPDKVLTLRNALRFAEKHAVFLASLLAQDFVQEIKDGSGVVPDQLVGRSILTVLAMEDHLQFSSPLRLVLILDAITLMYTAFARLDGSSENDLSVLACDSGSDKSFDFLGLAKLMEQVKECIVAIWDRKVMYRQIEAGADIALVAQSLPVIQRIEELRSAGALGPEESELLKRRIIDGASKFLEAGASIPELDAADNRPTARVLLRPQQQLLTGPSAGIEMADGDTDLQAETADSSDEMSPEDLLALESLLKKAKRSQKS